MRREGRIPLSAALPLLGGGFSHGGADCAAPFAGAGADDWSEVAVALADRWRIIALDQRGHGGSARPGEYSFELMCDDLAAFIDKLGLERPLLVGHSMGGSVAYLHVEAFPGRVRKLVIVDTPPPFPPESPFPEPESVPQSVDFDG